MSNEWDVVGNWEILGSEVLTHTFFCCCCCYCIYLYSVHLPVLLDLP